jgi:cytochrome c oxidase subunit II
MRFKAFTVTQEQFASWIAHQQTGAAFSATPATPATPPPATQTKTAAAPPRGAAPPAAPPAAAPMQAGFVGYPREKLPPYTVPQTPIPAVVRYDSNLVGDATRGSALVMQRCIACHIIRGTPMTFSHVGPDLTHVGSRLTIAGGLFPNDKAHLGAWIKNARLMKPGVLMNTLGLGQYDPILKSTLSVGMTDQQIADVVAYLQALK